MKAGRDMKSVGAPRAPSGTNGCNPESGGNQPNDRQVDQKEMYREEQEDLHYHHSLSYYCDRGYGPSGQENQGTRRGEPTGSTRRASNGAPPEVDEQSPSPGQSPEPNLATTPPGRGARPPSHHRSPRSVTFQDEKRGRQLQISKAASQEHERRVAAALGGKTLPGSGSLGQPGDVRTDLLLVSCKYTDQRTLRINVEDIEKASREADEQDLTPIMAFDLASVEAGCEGDWVLVPLRMFRALLTR